VSVDGFRRFGAPTTVRLAVLGIADGCVPDPDERLYELLVAVIDEVADVCGREIDKAPLNAVIGRAPTTAVLPGPVAMMPPS
jgi:hypothetical protein